MDNNPLIVGFVFEEFREKQASERLFYKVAAFENDTLVEFFLLNLEHIGNSNYSFG